MSANHRICGTCVYCSFMGNCDRYGKFFTGIEQPACDAYEIHPLLAENAKLRELVRDMWHDGMCVCDELGPCAECEYHYHDRMRELGVEVDR